jgi:hypothetical protein
MDLVLNITSLDVGRLWHTGSKSFYHDQADRFELEPKDEVGEGGVMIWCGKQYLNAKIILSYFDSMGGDYRLVCTALMWDTDWQEWCIWMDFDSVADVSVDYEGAK